MVPTHAVGGGDEDFERGVAGASAHSGEARVNADRSVLHGDDGIRYAKAQVVMGMDSALGLWLQDAVIGLKPGRIFVHVHRSAAVSDIDAMSAIVLH